MKNSALTLLPSPTRDGNDFELEHLDTLEYNNEVYMAFSPPSQRMPRRASLLTSTWMTRSTA